jgi:molybdopterin/thiamine biosynthesis adenylyltransferase
LTLRSRYARQEAFTGIGRQGQERLRGARVLLVGTGALGSALAENLVRGGVGHLTIVDRDVVEFGNLQRQFLFDEDDARLAHPKAVAAARRLSRLNSDVTIEAHVADVDRRNVAGFVRGQHLVLDGTDNLATRYVVNDACLGASVPWIYAAVVATHGLVLSVRPKVTPCLRCVLGDEPPPGLLPTCETEGILAPAVMAVAAVAATEALKLLVGREAALLPGLVRVDVWDGVLEVTDMQGQAPSCPACTQGLFEAREVNETELLCGSGVIQIASRGKQQPDLPTLASRLAAIGDVVSNEHLLRLRAKGAEITIFSDGRTLVRGARDGAEARGLVARYIGS